ncbi:hypothetical protein OAO01_08360 [Oligoflexia bacterium]|nr:hypothetical protein [Oligoflexia bacterium]
MKGLRKVRTQIGVAFIFIILGVGNVLFGGHKCDYYEDQLTTASQELLVSQANPTSARTDTSALIFPAVNVDRQTQHLAKLKARLGYYRFAVLGGRIFLALAGVMLLLCLISLKEFEEPDVIDS